MVRALQAAIDKTIEEKQGAGFRMHLGASIIGRDCARQIWYTFRWAKRARFRARLLRLFDRGNREETRIIKWLRDAGVHVLDIDPNTGKQLRIEDHEGHFGGSLDSLLFDTPEYPFQWVLGEYKTHNDANFKEVKKHGVRKSHLPHFVQMQIYMGYTGVKIAFYFAVNKNDDEMYIELIEYDEDVAKQYSERALHIIQAQEPPGRISESPAWYRCRMCDYQMICHHGDRKDKNCRTCKFSKPISDGKWLCLAYNYELSEMEQKQGCSSHQEIPE